MEYFFTSKEHFAKDIAMGTFMEYSEVDSHLYGTSINSVSCK